MKAVELPGLAYPLPQLVLGTMTFGDNADIDTCLAAGGAFPNDPGVTQEFNAALAAVRDAAASVVIAAGIHTARGSDAARRLREDFTFASVARDLMHLEQSAAAHLAETRTGT